MSHIMASYLILVQAMVLGLFVGSEIGAWIKTRRLLKQQDLLPTKIFFQDQQLSLVKLRNGR
jgi:hypothetical protein